MNSEFLKYINDEAQRLSGVYVPLRAGFLRQRLVRRVPLSWLRPNPDDEFCSRDIGPNDGIIARYARAYREMKPATDLTDFIPDGSFDSDSVLNPLIVQRIHPGGYMILNGHHRWAAARQVGRKTIRVCVVNLTQKQDVQRPSTCPKTRNARRWTRTKSSFAKRARPVKRHSRSR